MEFTDGSIDGIIWRPLKIFQDARGWLCELYRHDDIAAEHHPVMAYVSMTEPGVARGPHEHIDQTDYFCFIGPSIFRVYLWDSRKDSPTYLRREVRDVGEGDPFALIVPPGIVHAYRNVGPVQGIVTNAANRLYKGWDRKEPIDEIRHEERAESIFRME